MNQASVIRNIVSCRQQSSSWIRAQTSSTQLHGAFPALALSHWLIFCTQLHLSAACATTYKHLMAGPVPNNCRLSYFYKHESCGQCTPCREGTGWRAFGPHSATSLLGCSRLNLHDSRMPHHPGCGPLPPSLRDAMCRIDLLLASRLYDIMTRMRKGDARLEEIDM